MTEIKSADPQKLAEHLRKGAKFDVGKAREGYFRAYDNQMIMEMYAVRAKEAVEDEGPVGHLRPARHGPGPSEDMEVLAPPKDGTCKMA